MELRDPSLWHEAAFIGGEWYPADKPAVAVKNPANEKTIGKVPLLNSNQVQRAIDQANIAFHNYKNASGEQRAVNLMRWYELICKNQEDLAKIITLEQGKPLEEARGEVSYAASFVQWFAEEGKRIYGDVIPHYGNNQAFILRQPVGVVAAITPWNFPAAMITRKCSAALAAGCSVIVKPAPETPFTALALADLAQRAGIPNGIFNVITGEEETVGKALTSSKIIRKLSFTGSTAVGRLLMQQCSHDIKKLSLELGGNAPFIVFADADLDDVINGILLSKYRNSGQTCVCPNRIFVHSTIHDEFVKKLCIASKGLTVGNGFDKTVKLGPLINQQAVNKVKDLVTDAAYQGARLCLGGSDLSYLGSNFYPPTVISGVKPDMRIAREEIFGPVSAVIAFDDEEQAITLANDTDYGLCAYFYTNDMKRIWRVGQALEYGLVCVNHGVFSSVYASFGGVKQSGLGREGSKYGIDEYLESKYMMLGNLHTS